MLHGERALLAEIDRAAELDADTVKAYARALGAHLVGVASADTLNAFPPDPRYPQTPERVSPHCRSVIVIVQRIPAGAFRCKQNAAVQYIDMLVLRRMDKIAYRLAEWLERLFADPRTLAEAAGKAHGFGRRDAGERLARLALALAGGCGTGRECAA